MSISTRVELCPECGGPLSSERFQSLCPACAWRALSGSPAMEEDTALPALLFRVAGHEVLGEIARGGAGVVYRARQLNPPRDVALKMLLPQQLGSEEMIARFQIEAETVAALDHPAILPVYTVGVHQETPFFTMKLATGGTLAQRAPRFHGHWRALAELVATLADAVQFAHSRGVIHRDLKPGNILFDEADRPFLSDFGLAKFDAATSTLTRSVSVMGTPAYLAPEVAQQGAQAATTSSDVYSLGSVFYELLTKRPPFSAESLAGLLKDIADVSPQSARQRVPGVPFDLDVICLRCLAKEPEKRFGSAGELANELRRWLAGIPIHSRPVSPLERTWQWCRRRPALSLLGAALLLTVLAAGVAQGITNRSLTRALASARTAQADAQQKLHASMLSEAKLRRNSKLIGQRHATLDILDRAARITPTLDVRNEIASALARADLKPLRELAGSVRDRSATIDFSPRLDQYILPLSDGGFELRDASDGRVIRNFVDPAGRGIARSLRFSANGRFLTVTSNEGAVAVWPIEGERPVWSVGAVRQNPVPIALHPSGRTVAFRAPEGEIVLRDLVAGSERMLVPEGTALLAMSFDPAGKRLVVARDGNVDLHDAATGELLWSRPDAPLGFAPAWSDDGRLLISANRSRHNLTVRESATGITSALLSGHAAFPIAARILPDNRRAATLAFDGTLRLWDLPTGQELLQAPFAPRGLALSSDGRRIGAVNRNDRPVLFEWSEETVFRELTGTFRVGVLPMGFTLDAKGDWLVTGGIDTVRRDNRPGTPVDVALWDTRREREVATFMFRSPREERITLVFDPNALGIVYSFASGGIWRRGVEVNSDRTPRIGPEIRLDAIAARALLRVEPEGDWIVHRLPSRSLAVWPKGDAGRETDLPFKDDSGGLRLQVDRHAFIARDASDQHVRFWSRQDGSFIGEIAAPRPAWLAFAPSGNAMVLGTIDSFQAWTFPRLERGPEWPMRSETSSWKSFGFSPSGRWFAGAIGGSAIEIRDGQSFGLLARLEPPLDLEMTGLVWSPDEMRVYLQFRGPRIFVWDLPALRREFAARSVDW